MTSANIAFPHLRISEDRIEHGPWMYLDVEGVEHPSNPIDFWDYDTKLRFGKDISFDARACIQQIGYRPGAVKLWLVVTAITGPGNFRWVAYKEDIAQRKDTEHRISIDIASEKLAFGLTLVTEIILAEVTSSGSALAPEKSGSRLWVDRHRIDIEGDSARFPMDMFDFHKALPSLDIAGADWYLQWNPDLMEADFIGSVILYLNAGRKDFVNRINQEEPVTLQWIRLDVIRQMCAAALERDQFVENADSYADGSVGYVIRTWLIGIFGSMSIKAIRALYSNQRSRFEAMIASTYGAEDA